MAKYIYASPIGNLLIHEEDNRIVGLDFYHDNNFTNDEFSHNEVIDQTIQELEEYFAHKRKQFNIPIQFIGTDYQIKVWEEMRKIPYGKTNTYGNIAINIGNPKGSRSVGLACGKNPIMIIVPCHRVIGKSGKLTGFAGGIDVKEKLLIHENNQDWKA